MAETISAVSLPLNAALALEAFERAQAEIAAGSGVEARKWLDRAHRLAPRDQTIALTLASASLGHDDRQAVTLFEAITCENDVREAWLGLATARRRLGDVAGAAAALSQALARHVPDLRLGTLADGIAREAGAPGWCGLSGTGTIAIHPVGPEVAFVSRHNGQRLDDRASRRPEIRLRDGVLSVETPDGRHLLGSPIDIGAIARTVGCVEAHDGGLRGWAWHPGDPDTDPVLTIRAAMGARQLRITASDVSIQIDNSGLLARPRGFVVPPASLVGMAGLLHVQGRDGRDMLGSPLDPGAEQRSAAAAAGVLARLYPIRARTAPRGGPPVPPVAVPADIVGAVRKTNVAPRRQPTNVLVMVHGAPAESLDCIESVLTTLRRPDRLVVVDDASREPELVEALNRLAARRRIVLIRNPRNLGFAASANVGLAASAGRDVVLLNSDTLVAEGWLEGLRSAAYSEPDIGTATPLSNDATILSYPDRSGGNKLSDLPGTRRLAALARRANGTAVVDIPVGVGFCMFIRRECLDAVGLLRADVFAQGYGEENDFCLRARHLGWRHVAAPGVFVAHVGSGSFGAAARHLRARNGALLERMYPGYERLIAAHVQADPLAPARRRLDLLRWRALRRRGQSATILITHEGGGGVERQIAASVERHRQADRRAIVLRPARTSAGQKCVLVGDGAMDDFPNLRFAMPDELPALRKLLAAENPCEVELHHMVGHHPAIAQLIEDLDLPYNIHVHDYAWLCARIALVGPGDRYCGEPDATRCDACVADMGNLIEEDIRVGALRERSARLFHGAQSVIVPTADTATRIRRHFPDARPTVVAHEDDASIAEPLPPVALAGRCRVCVVGAIGIHKGYQVLLDCARDAEERRLPLEFVVVGHTIDDRRLLATGRVFITGTFAPDEVVELIREQHATIALLPSIFPETWCLSLAEIWRAGLQVVAFDIGAPAERIRHAGRGLLLPLGLQPAGINNALVAASGLSRHE